MRSKKLLVVLVGLLVASLAIVACGPSLAEFELSNLTISPASVELGEEVAISVDVTNTGGLNGSYTANLTIDGETFAQQELTLEPGDMETVTFNYTPEQTGTYTIMIGEESGTLNVTPPTEEYWKIPYQVVGGEITLLSSLLGETLDEKTVDFPAATMDMWISKAVVNGSREVIIDAASFSAEPATVPDMMLTIDMDLTLSLEEDATGTLYVADGVGDVDVHSEVDTAKAYYIFGDGTMDPPGSVLLQLPLVGDAEVSFIEVTLPMDVFMTTGNSSSHVTKPGDDIDDSELEGNGVPFTKDGGPAPYVGTSGTIIATGAALDLRLVGFDVDFQYRIVMEIEPVPGWEQE